MAHHVIRNAVLAVCLPASLLTNSFASVSAAPVRQAASMRAQAASIVLPQPIRMTSIHTGETITLPAARADVGNSKMREFARFMRDRRNDQQVEIAPRLVDIIYQLSSKAIELDKNVNLNYEVISGYRSASSNDQLRNGGAKVATVSQHTAGTAIDLRLTGFPLEKLRDLAWCMQSGGVGYYPEAHNNFIHIDTSRVRFWPAANPKWACM